MRVRSGCRQASSSVTSGRRLCLALRPAGRATSSGLARDIGCPGGAFGFLMLSNTGRACNRFVVCGELLLIIVRLHSSLLETAAMLSPRQIRCQTKQEARVGTCSQGFSRRSLVPLLRSFYKLCSGFTATRTLREHPQRTGGFSTTSLLEFVNPIGYGPNHIARGFTGSVCLCFNSWARFLALFYDSDCFLVRHCLFSSFR
jgi:hypothetical protein